jgi:predicted aspartyl protease
VIGRWQRAIQQLRTVPPSSQNHALAQTKLAEYQRNLSNAQQRRQRLQQPASVPVIPAPLAQASSSATVQALSYRVPILTRRNGTPIIEVAFGQRRYPMILDTGASHTLITRRMAEELGITPTGQVQAATASQSSAVFHLGQVEQIAVADIRQTNFPVGIGDAVEIGLLGNDFYRAYDLILREQSVEFRPRSAP